MNMKIHHVGRRIKVTLDNIEELSIGAFEDWSKARRD
jgi:hypothetical protein